MLLAVLKIVSYPGLASPGNEATQAYERPGYETILKKDSHMQIEAKIMLLVLYG